MATLLIVRSLAIEKLFQFCTGFQGCTKHPLVQDLLLLLKPFVLNNYLMLFQKYSKWSIITWKCFMLKADSTLISKILGCRKLIPSYHYIKQNKCKKKSCENLNV